MYEVTFDDALVTQGSAAWARILFDADINLQGGESTFWFAVHDPTVSNVSYRVGKVKLDQKTLITLLQQSAIGELSLMSERNVPLEPTGTYDCETGQYMEIIAAYIRNRTVQNEAWLVEPDDVFFMLSRNTYFQVSVNDALTKAGYTGVSGANGIPLIYKDWATFVPPKLPSDCGYKTVGGGETTTPKDEGFIQVADIQEQEEYKFPTMAVAAGAIAGVVGVIGVGALMKNR